MTIYVHYIVNPDYKITIWDKTDTVCVVQSYNYGKKTKKAKSTIKEYNGKNYIICDGHRYYLDEFIKVEI